MRGIETSGKTTQYLVIRTAFAGRLDQFGSNRNVLVAASIIEIVVFHEHRSRQHDIRHLRGFGHELLVHHHEQVLARKASAHQRLLGATVIGLVF
jgi:hypothetical protein